MEITVPRDTAAFQAHVRALGAVPYVDTETMIERRGGKSRLAAQKRFYRDHPKMPLEPWTAEGEVERAQAAG